jgi:hypothetical protein
MLFNLQKLGSNSSYGRVIYTKSRWDLRLFTRIPRGSKLWKKRYPGILPLRDLISVRRSTMDLREPELEVTASGL